MSGDGNVRHSTAFASLLAIVVALGAAAIARSAVVIVDAPISGYAVLLVLLIIVAGRYRIKMPGYSATVSVSELFVFLSLLLFGPALATLAVAADGIITSLRQSTRRGYRILFNVAEAAVTTWTAGQVFLLATSAAAVSPQDNLLADLLLPVLGLAITYFVLNTGLTAAAIALESGVSIVQVWRPHALYLGINYLTAASVAALIANMPGGMTLAMIGLGAPLLILSYVAYLTASRRTAEAEAHLQEVAQLYRATVEALATAVDVKDQVTHGHILRVQRHSQAVARALGVTDPSELKAIETGSLLHDVGKLAIPDHVIYKPGPLTTTEFDCMKLHAKLGATILASVDFPFPVVPIVKHHHERWDGRGYPDGLAGTDIPLGARILTVVDCFDALISDRPYRKGLSTTDAIALLEAGRGTQYEPAVLDAFIALIPELMAEDRALAPHAVAAGALISEVGDIWHRASEHSPDQARTIHATLRANADTVIARIRDRRPDVHVCVYVTDETDELKLVESTPQIQAIAASARHRLGHGQTGWVAAYRQPIVNSDPRLDFADASDTLGLRSSVCLPVFGSGTLIGVLSVYAETVKAFSQDDVLYLRGMAAELAAVRATRPERLRLVAGSASGRVKRLHESRPSRRQLPVNETPAAGFGAVRGASR